MQQYIVGEVPSLACVFTAKLTPSMPPITVGATGQVVLNVPGTPTDPSTITLKVVDPTGAATTYAYGGGVVLRDTVGVYYALIALTLAGTWNYEWLGDGGTNVAKPGWGTLTAVAAPV